MSNPVQGPFDYQPRSQIPAGQAPPPPAVSHSAQAAVDSRPGDASRFDKVRKSSHVADFTLVCNNQEFRVNRRIISEQSEYLLTLCQNTPREEEHAFVEIYDDDNFTFSVMLDFMHTGRYDIKGLLPGLVNRGRMSPSQMSSLECRADVCTASAYVGGKLNPNCALWCYMKLVKLADYYTVPTLLQKAMIDLMNVMQHPDNYAARGVSCLVEALAEFVEFPRHLDVFQKLHYRLFLAIINVHDMLYQDGGCRIALIRYPHIHNVISDVVNNPLNGVIRSQQRDLAKAHAHIETLQQNHADTCHKYQSKLNEEKLASQQQRTVASITKEQLKREIEILNGEEIADPDTTVPWHAFEPAVTRLSHWMMHHKSHEHTYGKPDLYVSDALLQALQDPDALQCSACDRYCADMDASIWVEDEHIDDLSNTEPGKEPKWGELGPHKTRSMRKHT